MTKEIICDFCTKTIKLGQKKKELMMQNETTHDYSPLLMHQICADFFMQNAEETTHSNPPLNIAISV